MIPLYVRNVKLLPVLKPVQWEPSDYLTNQKEELKDSVFHVESVSRHVMLTKPEALKKSPGMDLSQKTVFPVEYVQKFVPKRPSPFIEAL